MPPYLINTMVFTALLNAEQLEIDQVNNSIKDIIDQCFVDTATWGLDYWESFLGIVTDRSRDIDYRRSVIKAKLRGYGTVTTQLIENVSSSFSNGQVAVIQHPDSYSFEVKFVGTIGVPPNISDLQNAIAQIKPAHLAVIYTYLYTQWSKTQSATWASLKAGTWGELMNGEVV